MSVTSPLPEAKYCGKCRKPHPVARFSKCSRSPDGLQQWCKQAQKDWLVSNREKRKAQQRRWYAAQRNSAPEAFQKRSRLRKYGLSVDEFEAMWVSQGGRCSACHDVLVDGPATHIDHCHKTGVVRGILCRSCNVALGQLGDDPIRIQGLLMYIVSDRMAA